MRFFTVAAAAAIMATRAFATECDLMCAMIYSVDQETCKCVPIAWMECHPQYNPASDCYQRQEDVNRGRNPEDNPYSNGGDQWYENNLIANDGVELKAAPTITDG